MCSCELLGESLTHFWEGGGDLAILLVVRAMETGLGSGSYTRQSRI